MSAGHPVRRVEKLRPQLLGMQPTSAGNGEDEPFLRRTSQDPDKGIVSLAEERKRASFAVRELTHLIDGSPRITALKEQVMKDLEEMEEAQEDDYDLDHQQLREKVLAKIRRAFMLFLGDGTDLEKREARVEVFSIWDTSWHIRNGVHYGLFTLGAIGGQATEEQKAEWLPRALTLQIFGCFAMTELGHGSNLRGLETTARYDKEREEFVINTPTDTATKWWIGGAGQTATHAAVYARLILGEEDKGVQTFIVPLRDEDHHPLPGVTIGDCGRKMGLEGVDNGWIQFNHVRVPRSHMLMRFAEVSKAGEYREPPKAQLAYGALLGTRGQLIRYSVNVLKKALMISVRYGAVRRQGGEEGERESKLLDYQSHQVKLMPVLAAAYAFHWMGAYVMQLSAQLEDQMDNEDMSDLPDVHGTMSGLKAYTTWYVLGAMEVCRQACGGHGYSAYNGLARTISDFAVFCTFEGDNTVMALQTSRYLMASYAKYSRGEKITGSVRYLEMLSGGMNTKAEVPTPQQLLDPEVQLEAMRFHASHSVERVAQRLKKLREQQGCSEDKATLQCQVDLMQAAEAHVYYNVAVRFAVKVKEVAKLPGREKESQVLKTLSDCFVLCQLQKSLSFFLQHNYFTSEQAEWINEKVLELCQALRANAVPLVDAFNYSDRVLGSCIGREDGDVYPALLDRLKRVPHGMERAPYYEKGIKPILESDMFN